MNGWGGDEYNTDYPYTSGTTQQDGTCKGIVSKDIATHSQPNSYSMIASAASDESAMAVQIQHSPMSVCVDAANLWQTYTGGLITASDGCGTSIDHAVQAVGINTDTFNGERKTYWIVRNSWTASWVRFLLAVHMTDWNYLSKLKTPFLQGEQGYIYVEYGSNNCGITSQATIVQLA